MNIDIIKPTAAVALADLARKMEQDGKKVIKLQTGDPDFSTHDSIIQRAHKALVEGNTHYSFSQGLPALRKELAIQYSKTYNVDLKENEFIITHGAAEGFFTVIAALIEPGDEVIILEPNWPTVDSLVLLMGGVPVKINSMLADSDILDQLSKNFTAKTKMICFNTPNNPTGMVLSQSLIDAICKWAIDKNMFIVADEVYNFLQFNKDRTTSAKFLGQYKKYIYINSFSKKFAMTGWRIGYIIGENDLIKKLLKPSQLVITNVAPFVQLGALEGITNKGSLSYCDQMLEEYKSRRDQIVEYCDRLGVKYIYPSGAFYLFIELPSKELSDVDFCNRLLNEFNTCMVPGSGFGASGKGYIRLSFANTLENVKAGLDQVKKLADTLSHS